MENENKVHVDASNQRDVVLDESDCELNEIFRGKEIGSKPGIIYLSSVPSGFNVGDITDFFTKFGGIGHVRLDPAPGQRSVKKGKGRGRFTTWKEGWVEFKSKKIAKSVAENLNTTPVLRGKKDCGQLWNIKYLPRFKWIHLQDEGSHANAVKAKRMRNDIQEVKLEAEQFQDSVKRGLKRKKRGTGGEVFDGQQVKQFKSVDQNKGNNRKRFREERGNRNETEGNKKVKADRSQFLKSVFGKGG